MGTVKNSYYLGGRLMASRTDHEVCFALLLSLWLFSSVLTTSLYSITLTHTTIIRVGLALVMLVFDLYFSNRRYAVGQMHFKHFLLSGACLILFGSCVSIGEYWLPQVVLIAYCARHFDIRFLIRVWLIAVAVSVAFIVASCLLGAIPDYQTDSRGWFGRHSLGFNYSTFLSHYCLAMTLCYMYLKRFRVEAHVLILLVLLDILVYVFTDSRNSCVLIMLAIALCLVKKFGWGDNSLRNPVFHFLLKYSVIICFLVSVFLLLGVDTSSAIGESLNKITSSRIVLTQTAFNEYGVTLLGAEINWSTPHYLADGSVATGYMDRGGEFVESAYLYVDCSFLNSLLSNGVFVFSLFLILLTALSLFAVDQGDACLALIIAFFALHSVFDPQMLSLQYSPYLLLLGIPWFQRAKRKPFEFVLVRARLFNR